MTLARARLAIAFFLTLTVSCADSTSSESCQLGQQMPCTCGNGESSQRICLETGAGYSACIGCALDGGTSIPPIQADLAQAVRPDDGGVLDFAGVAKPSCSAANCTGCCNGNTCAVTADQSDQQCHVGSLTVCQKCPTGFSCVADQACAKQGASCDPGSCPTGCCEGGVCLEANPSHCGAGGGSCTQCASNCAPASRMVTGSGVVSMVARGRRDSRAERTAVAVETGI